MIRAVTFASCYVYSPCGSCAASARSRRIRARLKAGDARFIIEYVRRVRQQSGEGAPLTDFFAADDILVPVPGSAPKQSPGLTVTEHLAAALIGEGLGRGAWHGLLRTHAVRKSATAATGARPTVAKHYDSFAIGRLDTWPDAERVMLIDDVVTKGRTLLAAATRLHETFPGARIRAFALLRTKGLMPDVIRLLEPCVGQIRWRAGDAHREP
jgi:predicted amidophosphoribosyltransferase